jgi:hypothetical protein
MGAVKEMMMNLQQEFAVFKFVKDGCPEEDAKNESWDSMVAGLYDGNESAALTEFYLWNGKQHDFYKQDSKFGEGFCC